MPRWASQGWNLAAAVQRDRPPQVLFAEDARLAPVLGGDRVEQPIEDIVAGVEVRRHQEVLLSPNARNASRLGEIVRWPASALS